MFSCEPMLTSLTRNTTRGSEGACSSSSAIVPSSETLSQITSSKSVKSCDSTDSMHRPTTSLPLRTASPTDRSEIPGHRRAR